jgi:hypothetical protein
MRKWKELWFSVIIQWVCGLLGIFLVARLVRERRGDVMPFVLFFLLLVFVNAVAGDLHKRLEDLRQRSEQMQETLDELEPSSSGGGSELEA